MAYYWFKKDAGIDSCIKARYGERVPEDLNGFSNIMFGHRQKDIDNLFCFAGHTFLCECKNWAIDSYISEANFSDKIEPRFVDGQPIAEFYSHYLSDRYKKPYPKITRLLVIPKLKAMRPIIAKLKGMGIYVIEIGIQIINESQLQAAKRTFLDKLTALFLSVETNKQESLTYPLLCHKSIGKIEFRQNIRRWVTFSLRKTELQAGSLPVKPLAKFLQRVTKILRLRLKTKSGSEPGSPM